MPAYAELHALSAFSFRRAAALPQELVQRAYALGYEALALTDECSMAGVVRAHEAARESGLKLIIGSELRLTDQQQTNLRLVLLAPNQTAYSQICQLITKTRRRVAKGQYQFKLEDLNQQHSLDDVLVIWKPELRPENEQPNGASNWPQDSSPCLDAWHEQAKLLKSCFNSRLWIGATRLLRPGERAAFQALELLGQHHGLPRLACGDIRISDRDQRALGDVMSALACQKPLRECGLELAANAERHLRPISTLEKIYPQAWLDETVQLSDRCNFSMNELGYRYPREIAPAPLTPARHLRQLTLTGMHKRYGNQVPDTVRALVARELKLIEEMAVEAFFLTVHDIVRFARSRGILCQGRGSAANSAVCYCLGVTEVDPSKQQLLFERFLSKERNEPPDIDVDFEHERREEVLQYVYEKYGRERAALAATVISYRPKSALKDAGRALGLDPVRMNRLTSSLAWWDKPEVWPERLRECGFDPEAAVTRQLMHLTGQLLGRPRHLSQHVGGMVISDDPLHHLVPVENAAMADRTIIQWDKDDLETLGLLKVDCLALGMLTVIRKAMGYVGAGKRETGDGKRGDDLLTLATIPREDSATYDMLGTGDAVGVFQVESRAQMAMLPRLKPRCFYDLVVEVAIVRPGPIQGDMVHPYLERRDDPEKVRYPSPDLEKVLKRTLGVPIFQEQVMQIAIVAAGFTPGEADQLRRAMAAWKRRGGLEPFREKLMAGMARRGYPPDFADRIFSQIKGFGDYGFPESHAASFALLTYFSAWLKCHHPAAFACALLNSQPMGFYAPAQIINDARRHGVRVWPVDVRFSGWDCGVVGETRKRKTGNGKRGTENGETGDGRRGAGEDVETGDGRRRAERAGNQTRLGVRLGLRVIKGINESAAERIVRARNDQTFVSVQDLVERAALDRGQVRKLADGGALKGLAGHRGRARWEALAAQRQGDLLAGIGIREERVTIQPPDRQSNMLDDYASTGLSLDHHPAALIRPQLGRGLRRARDLASIRNDTAIQAVGLVTHRQRPGTASGVVFLSLEDETGIINVVVWPKLLERYRQEVLESQLLRVAGTLQNAKGTQHLIAKRLFSEDYRLARLSNKSRDFH